MSIKNRLSRLLDDHFGLFSFLPNTSLKYWLLLELISRLLSEVLCIGNYYLVLSADNPDSRGTTDRYIFVVRVILGRSYVNKNDAKIHTLPCTKRDCMTPGCTQHQYFFDSVVSGRERKYREFLMYDPDRCLPQFLIKYDRRTVKNNKSTRADNVFD